MGPHSDRGGDRGITQHDVELVDREFRQQFLGASFVAIDTDRLFQLQRGLDQAMRDEFGKHIGDTDRET